MTSQESDLFRFDGSYRDSDSEKDFHKTRWQGYVVKIRFLCLLSGVAYLTGIYSDTVTLGNAAGFYYMMVARLITFGSALYCIFSTFSKSYNKTQRALLLYFILITLTECFELYLLPEIGKQGLPLLLIIMLLYSLFLPVRYVYSAFACLFATVLYSGILLIVHEFPLKQVSPIIASFGLVTAMALSIMRNINRSKRSEAKLISQLKEVNEKLEIEIAEKELAKQELEQLARIDGLTNIYNRRHFIELAEREKLRADRSRHCFSLLFLDIDHFKAINDSYGHDIGDLVLRNLVTTCQENIRVIDILGRYGGEEFVLLLPETENQEARRMAERLRECISETVTETPAGEISITVSIGISSNETEEGATINSLLKQADIALYKAKENGRNRVEFR
ncbi:GGDEF domain-containing protein [Vibrio sp. JC009]|uniref:GGDEF domain-containing protein n=1 Tax=Vibrio sp. JC009 TaxID=2912314 RepID=UPI0023B013A5|nr:GGDEF domain-containing protein [Vibrio sp. JC009]WED20876.1 GGDEF domain-containing protein [Vibrio sp. JC009]